MRRLAAVQRLERGEVVGLRLDAVGELEEQRRSARPASCATISSKALCRGGDGLVDLLGGGLGQRQDRLAGLRVEDLLGLLRCR